MLDIEEDDYGTTWATQRRPTRQELTVSWQDGYDLSRVRRDPTVPYLSAGPASSPLVTDQDVWFQLSSMLRGAEAGALPAVALLEVPPANATVIDPSMFLYSRLTGTLQRNNVQGDEGRSEVERYESITAVEIV